MTRCGKCDAYKHKQEKKEDKYYDDRHDKYEHKERKEHKEEKCTECELEKQKERKECEKFSKGPLSFKKVLSHFNDFYSLSSDKMAFFGAETPAPRAPNGYLSLYTLNYPCVKEKVSYKTWCADVNIPLYNLNVLNGSGVTSYKLVSLLSDSAPEAYISLTQNCCDPDLTDCYPYLTTNFGAVNYILNEVNRYVATLNPMNNEIQVSIWNLLHNEDLSDLQTYTLPDADLAIVRMIVDDALSGQAKWNMSVSSNSLCKRKNKLVAENKIVGLLGFPNKTSDPDGVEICYQAVLIPVRLCDFERDFNKCFCQ